MIRVLSKNGDGYVGSDSHYYIGETEVTQELWKAIMGTSNNPSGHNGDKLPVENISQADLLSFIEKLNSKTGLTFSLPTSTRWQYAFKGACISKNYTYSGSNSSSDVAWHSGNSNNTTHEVKTKQPNEIGIYDMSGNVYEYISNGYSYGGCYSNAYDSNFLKGSSSSSSYSLPSTGVGFRLCLDL